MAEVEEEQQAYQGAGEDAGDEARAHQLVLNLQLVDLEERVQLVELHAHVFREGGVFGLIEAAVDLGGFGRAVALDERFGSHQTGQHPIIALHHRGKAVAVGHGLAVVPCQIGCLCPAYEDDVAVVVVFLHLVQPFHLCQLLLGLVDAAKAYQGAGCLQVLFDVDAVHLLADGIAAPFVEQFFPFRAVFQFVGIVFLVFEGFA